MITCIYLIANKDYSVKSKYQDCCFIDSHALQCESIEWVCRRCRCRRGRDLSGVDPWLKFFGSSISQSEIQLGL